MMWLEVLKSIWNIIKNPTVIVSIVGVIISGYLWIGKVSVENKLNKALSENTVVKGQLTNAMNNQTLLMKTIEDLNKSQDNLKTSIGALQSQIKSEQVTTNKWKKVCEGKPTDIKEVSSKPLIEKGVVVDEKTSEKFINYINNMFSTK